MKMRKRHTGFTLLELLAVVAILAVLAAILFPFAKGAMQKAASAKCISNLRTLGVAAHSYAAENNGQLPRIVFTPASSTTAESKHSGEQWDAQIAPFLGVNLALRGNFATPFVCPAGRRYSADPEKFPLSRNLSYGLNTHIQGQRLAAMRDAQTLILISERGIGEGSNENIVIGGGSSSSMFISNSEQRLKHLTYERHGGLINILFVDGHVSPRAKLGRVVAGFRADHPRGARFINDGATAPSE